MPDSTSPSSPTALAALCVWLDEFDTPTTDRGRSYFKSGRVLRLTEQGSRVSANVRGSLTYETTLFWEKGRWSSECDCPVELGCKHAYAVGLAWLRKFDRDSPVPGAPLPPIPGVRLASEPAPVIAPRTRKLTFREQWTPVLAKKLGRPLTSEEGHRLGQLSAVYHDFKSRSDRLYEHTLTQNGFPASPEHLDSNGTAYADWFDREKPPADPWELWQYLAYDAERSGRDIPEAFRPLTDTTALARRVEDKLLAREVAEWRRAFDPVTATRANPYAQVRAGVEPPADLRLRLEADGQFYLEARAAADKPWKHAAAKWLEQLGQSGPADFAALPAPAAALANALAAECRNHYHHLGARAPLSEAVVSRVLTYAPTHRAVVLPDGSPWRVETEPLVLEATVNPVQPQRLDLALVAPDGQPAPAAIFLCLLPGPHYLHEGRVYRGPPRAPQRQMPVAVLADATLLTRLREIGLRLPAKLEVRVRRVALRPVLRCWLEAPPYPGGPRPFCAQLLARSDDPPCTQHWCGVGGWQWTENGAPPRRGPDDPILDFNLTAANEVGAHFAAFKLTWDSWNKAWSRTAIRDFPELFLEWRASLPPDLTIEAQGELAGLAGPPLRAHFDFSVRPAAGEAGRDWFDLTLALRVEDTTLTPEEIALLLKARGKWVQLPRRGWRRLEITDSPETRATLGRLGLDADELTATGRPVAHRLHALQLAGEADALAARDASLAATLRARAAQLAGVDVPALPVGLTATLRPYQHEGFHFLVHLSANGLGGILADDMGLGKTVQTLAWLLHLAALPRAAGPRPVIPLPPPSEPEETPAAAVPDVLPRKRGRPRQHPAPLAVPSDPAVSAAGRPKTRPAAPAESGPRPFRALVVCPKSVVHGWLAEGARFAPSLALHPFTPATAKAPHPPGPAGGPALLIANYTQLRLNAAWFRQQEWDAVILDEAQFIKNPLSQTSLSAYALQTRHRLALTGTPVENRLLDLWSLLAFAQPGLLGTQASFGRQHRDDDPTAPGRLQLRVRHFILRRTKAQVAPDLPARTEDEIVVELEPAQRRLYDAELKRARAQLLGLKNDRALDAVRFNILASLLRLRQICCHPALVDPAHAELPSAKLTALLERLEELRDEGHQVLVFSQFVEMLELIRARLVHAGIGHLLLTGATENRAELVQQFQADRTKTVFLLSLKAAGFGLNLTAASYAILYDPWWNPAVEAQAIDRTHRIGQTRPVTAYRLLADDTIEQKIRTLQREKAALAGSIVREESLAKVLDLASLRNILG